MKTTLHVESLEERRLLAVDMQLGFNNFEPTIVVDPNNSDVVAAAQFRTVRISFDRGASFPMSITVNAPNGYAGSGGDPSLSFDSQSRLYFSYLASNPAPVNPNFPKAVFAARIDVDAANQTATLAQNTLVALEGMNFDHDKEWVAADHFAGSPFQDSAYVVWTQLGASQVMFSRTTDAGANWSAPQQLDDGASGFVWPSEVAVAPNGDVWTTWHTNSGDVNPANGTVRMRRSVDGGANFQAELANLPFTAGNADVNDNAPPNPRVPGNLSWWLGSAQPRILTHPTIPGTLYVVTVDDPNNAYGNGDESDVVFARSTDFGATWTTSTISHAPVGAFEIMPAAAIDELGNIAVAWYDNRRGLTNAGLDAMPGNGDDDFLLDVYATVSRDGGLTFTNDFRLNDVPFDPDLGATDRFPPNNVLRIGEYFGLAAAGGTVFVDWTGNNAGGQTVLFDKFNMLGPFADSSESNNTLSTATILGSPPAVTLQDRSLNMDDPVDFYKYTAHETGTLAVNAYYDIGVSNVEVEVLDRFGNVIATGTDSNILPGLDQEHVLIPVVAGQEYFIRVFAADMLPNPVIYDLEVENFEAPFPLAVDLDPADDSGSSNLDYVTFETTNAHFFIQADLEAVAAAGVTILSAAQAAAGVTPGAAVQVFVNGASVGYANVVAGTNNTLFVIDLNADLTKFSVGGPNAAGAAGYPGFTNFITAAVRIFDPQRNGAGAPAPATARGPLSDPLRVIFDATSPLTPPTPDLLATSDSGASNTDNITNVNPPAFQGTGEANAKIRVFADGILVGQGIVGTDATDGNLGNGLGRWEVTIEPLADGTYDITAELEDLAGNISPFNETPLSITIDTGSGAPQRPTLDLVDTFDTGWSDKDNVTNLDTLDFRVSAEIGSMVVIKDGETVIDSFVMPAVSFTIRTISWPVAGIATEGPHPLSAEASDEAGNRSAQSEELLVTIDTMDPDPPTTPDLLATSDSGASDSDDVTNVNPPAFGGFGEPNSLIRIFADGILVGEGIVGSDESDGDPLDGLGIWEVTIEPLADGTYEITAQLEDQAGNNSEMSEALTVTIDTAPNGAPQRPTLDLVDAYDTGWSDKDNVTNLNPLQFRVSAEPNTMVFIKDGETVIDSFAMPAVPFTFRTISWPVAGIATEGPHPLSAEAFDLAGNRSAQSEELLVTIDTTIPSPPSAPDLLAASDTGTFNNDNVTNLQALAFQGTGESNARVRVFANGELVGQGVVGTDLTFPPGQLPEDPPAIGTWEITTEPLADGTYTITVEVEDQAGNISEPIDDLTVTVDTILPDTPYLDLVDASDTGRHNQDDITNDNTPTVTLTADDVQAAGLNLQPHDIRYRIFDRDGTGPDVLLVNSFATIPGLTTGNFFTEVLPTLADGVHNLKVEVEDRAGNISHQFLLQITIDTVAPPAAFGLPAVVNDGLDPGSDSGVIGNQATFTDRITNVTTPAFFGTSEANSINRVTADTLAGQILLGLDVAIPLDGNFAFPMGRWGLTSSVYLNDPGLFAYDGIRTLRVTAEDVAGNVSQPQQLDIFLDTQGPQVTNVSITDHPAFNLFGLKPDNAPQGPTPLVTSLTISLQDLPAQHAQFLRNAIEAGVAATQGLITLVGDHNGVITIDSIIVTNDPPIVGQAATASIELRFNVPLPDDRFTLTLLDTLPDIAGNALDGESNAIQPTGVPQFPSGDRQPGGDFVARFTVDSRHEIGTYAAANVYVDANGNFLADPQGDDDDFTNRDLTFALGIVPSLSGVVSPMGIHDAVFAGNFPNTVRNEESLFADGFDKLAAYGYDPVAGGFRWLIDVDNDGIIDPAEGDQATIQGANFQINGLPVAGDFDGNPNNGDEIGLFTGTQWHFDTNHNFVIDGGDLVVSTALRGRPIAGDFNGDGVEDLATWKDDQFFFNLATQPGGVGTQPAWSGAVNQVINWGLPGVSELPVAGDIDGDGIDDVGLFVQARTGTLPISSGNWHFLISHDYGEELRGGNQVTALNHPFSPSPLGNDLFAQFGDAFALPVVGNFDPPVSAPTDPTPIALAPLLGSTTLGTQTVTGEKWYALQPLRSGTISIDVTSTSGTLKAGLYNTNYAPLAGPAAASADGGAGISVVAGQKYMLRLSGDGAKGDVRITNHVPDADRMDTSRDGRVTPVDVLRIINELLSAGSHDTPLVGGDPRLYLDTTLDGRITPHDALQLVNYLLARSATAAPSNVAAPVAGPTAAAAPSALAFSLTVGGDSPADVSASSAAAPVDAVYAELAFSTEQPDDEPMPLMSAAPRAVASPATRAAQSNAADAALADDELEWRL